MSEPAVSLEDVGYQNLRVVADRLLETTRVEYVDEGVLLVMNPPGIEHRRIVRAIVDDAKRAFYTGAVTVNWAADENYQWDLPDGSGRFYVPDIVFIHPGATTAEEERTAIALVAEVTSPTSPDTVLNDRTTKPVQYTSRHTWRHPATLRECLLSSSRAFESRSGRRSEGCEVTGRRGVEPNDLVWRNVAALVKPPRGRGGRPSKSFTLEQAKALSADGASLALGPVWFLIYAEFARVELGPVAAA